MAVRDPFQETQRDVSPTVAAELHAAGFDDAQEIGRGGFGVVYRCVQPELGRSVAVKVLTEDFDDDNRSRFLREQQAMGRLTGHPNIVGVLQVGTTESGRPYIVMQFHPQNSLEALIHRDGPLDAAGTLRLGVKMAGALETAHRAGIIHRDVKPGNILITDYGEPALTDFGIAHIDGGFRTSTGTVAGSPAYTAPEVLEGNPPSPAADIYGLGATLFCALTGHAAFERRSGEQVVAQFLRITTQPVPDLRGKGVPANVSAAIAWAMSPDPKDRPASAAEFGAELRRLQSVSGLPADEMAVLAVPAATPPADDASHSPSSMTGPAMAEALSGPLPTTVGMLPLELTSFVGRRRELAELKELLSSSRLVTLTGFGGVGKTRLALRAAAEMQKRFSGGVRLVELGELWDQAVVVDVVATALGVRNRLVPLTEGAETSVEQVATSLANRHLLLVLDNCEHVVDAVAALVETLLHHCVKLQVLTTSREPLGIGGEVVLQVPPLTVADAEPRSGRHDEPLDDAVSLFAQRAAAIVPGFAITESNRETIEQICRRLDGLPLPIELAAARLRVMSAEQILKRLTDRYQLLTLGPRGVPPRQQTLRLSVDWSYELCEPREQQLWARLSVFAGSFELDAAETICAGDLTADELLDTLTSLIDKSILLREQVDSAVRFRMLETLRDYGREKAEQAGEYAALRAKHRDWYLAMALRADAEWIGPDQVEWIARLGREQPNFREAMTSCLAVAGSADISACLQMAAALYPYWLSHGQLREGRRWLDRALAQQPRSDTNARVKALVAATLLAGTQGDLPAATALLTEGQALVRNMTDPDAHARIGLVTGLLGLLSGDVGPACTQLQEALAVLDTQDDTSQIRMGILQTLGWAYELQGLTEQATAYNEQVLAIAEAHGEAVHRSYTVWAMGVTEWQQGHLDRAVELIQQGLHLTRLVDDPFMTAVDLEALAWIAREQQDAERAATLLGAAASLRGVTGGTTVLFPHLLVHHETCERLTREMLGKRAFTAARRKGQALQFDEAIAYALGETTTPAADAAPTLTTREMEVAALVAEGLTDKAIATQLVISQRTAQGHVAHILTKLGFTSRARIASWVIEQRNSEPG
ncbi:protein kinase [Nocardia jiangxiensis]|uniref:Protein kinase n=1 Tax=Nocardia jiangxiensis TaxID=282685 RepID=A0ABW6RUH9_9NOCA